MFFICFFSIKTGELSTSDISENMQQQELSSNILPEKESASDCIAEEDESSPDFKAPAVPQPVWFIQMLYVSI